MKYLPDDSENPEHMRHKRVLELMSGNPNATPARWYRIHVDYIPAMIALCDYYTHEDAHKGTPDEKALMVNYWTELQVLLMSGQYVAEEIEVDIDDPFCAHVANCIDSGALDDTLSHWLQQREGLIDPRRIWPDDPAGEIVLIDSCDRDSCYAIAKQLVELLHQIIRDSLQSLAAKFNSAEIASHLLSMVPGLGALPFDEWIQFTGLMVDVFASNYEAAYNEALKQRYICDLWCMTVQSCQLNIKDMARYFFSRFTSSVLEIDMLDFAELILQGTWSGEEIVHVMHGIAAYTLATGLAFANVSPVLLLNLIKSYYNDVDGDWEFLCAECDTSTHVVLNFAESPYNFVVSADSSATWEAGQGFTVYGRPATELPGARIEIDLPGDYGITRAKATAELRWGTSDNSLQVQHIILTDNVTPSIKTLKVAGQNGLVTTKSVEVTRSTDSRHIEILFKAGSKYTGSWVKIRTLELWFEGQPPYGWPEV